MKTSNVWIHYTEDPKDKTKAICQVNDCGFRASRGKTGGGTAHLTTSGMLSHLKNKHPKQHKEVLNMNNEVRTANSQKRLLEEEADEMEKQLEVEKVIGRLVVFFNELNFVRRH